MVKFALTSTTKCGFDGPIIKKELVAFIMSLASGLWGSCGPKADL